MKRFLRIVLILLALLVITGFVAFLALDSLVASGIRHGGTYALGVDTSVDGVDVHLGSEIRASFSGLSVENPEGFEAKHFMRLEDGSMRFPANVALAQVVAVPELKLSGIAVDLERRGGKTNYGVLLDNLERLSAGGAPKEKEEGLGKRFQIDRIVLADITATIDLLPLPGVAGDPTRVEVKIPVIEIENVGSDMSTAQIFSLVVRTLLTAVLQNAGSLLPADMLKDLQGRLGALGNVVFDLPNGAAEASQQILGIGAKVLEGSAQDASKDLGEVGEKALKDVGGLLNKKKKD